MKKIKIVHICMGFPVEYPGGITNYVRSLANAQSLNGDDVIVYCNGDDKNNKGANLKFSVKRYNSSIRPFTLDLYASDPTNCGFYADLVSEQADVYHIHSLLGIDIRFTELFSKSGLNYIVSLHDYNFICPRVFMVDKNNDICRKVDLSKCSSCIGRVEQFDFIHRAISKLKITSPTITCDRIYKRSHLFSMFLRKASFVLPVSSRVGEIFADYTKSNQKVITIGNDTAYIIPERNKVKRSNISVAFLGSFTRIKGAELFIDICEKNTNPLLKFCFYGRGDKKLLERFKAVGGEDFGAYNAVTLPEILKKIDVGAVLSIWEDNGPQVVMEMLNNAIPVLGTKRGGISDFINSENGFLFEPDEGIDSALKWLNSLTTETVSSYHRNIQQLKTPEQHYHEINDIYLLSLGK
ncbi:TPA: glycosyltransferase [Citrobacter braakii]